MERVYEFLRAAHPFYLATMDGTQPRVRPFGTVSLYEGRIYLETGLRKNVGRQLLANPKVEIAAMQGERWLRITAEAVLDERREALDFVFAEHPELLRLYTPGDGNAAVFYLRNATAQITAFDGTVETICF